MKIIALIPARGGSKGIPKKNLALVGGKPLIAWTIEAALNSKHLDEIIVSTENEEIAECARKYGAKVPFLRPKELAADATLTIDVALHLINWYQTEYHNNPDYLLTLQPTSPFRITQDIDNAIAIVLTNEPDAIVSVYPANPHPYLTKKISKDGTLSDFIQTDKAYLRRQDMPPAYALNGAIYLNKVESLINEKSFLPEHTLAYVMPAERSLDIDDHWDLKIANMIFSQISGNSND